MVAERISLLSVGMKLLALVFICLLLRLPLKVLSGERRMSTVMLGVMQTVQRAEFLGAIVAMRAYWPCHLGIDNLNVARTVGRLLDKDCMV